MVEFVTRIIKLKPQIKVIGAPAARTLYILSVSDEFPIVGICFGHQIVGRALGGGCVLNKKWEVGPTPLALTDLGKEIFGVETLVRETLLPLGRSLINPLRGCRISKKCIEITFRRSHQISTFWDLQSYLSTRGWFNSCQMQRLQDGIH